MRLSEVEEKIKQGLLAENVINIINGVKYGTGKERE
jgi:hypothetical protein